MYYDKNTKPKEEKGAGTLIQKILTKVYMHVFYIYEFNEYKREFYKKKTVIIQYLYTE